MITALIIIAAICGTASLALVAWLIGWAAKAAPLYDRNNP